MSKSGTCPGGIAMESLSNMDSAGSCDSVISANSGYSDDSLEHLSTEERACLMYLEETIEALEVQEDSGLSNDEPDACSKAETKGMDPMRLNDTSSMTSSSVSLPSVQDTPGPAPASVTIMRETKQNSVNQASELLFPPASAANSNAPQSGSLVAQPNPPSVNRSEVLDVALSEKCDAESFPNTEPSPGLCTKAEMDLGIIPPPSDFMDGIDPLSHQEKVEDQPIPTEISSQPEMTDDMLHPGDPSKKTSEISSLAEDPSRKPLPLTTSDPPGIPESRNPPAVAPKPKVLPSNIILKSQKVAAGSVGNSGSLVPPSSDKVLLDPQRVRIEALRKLGLLKSHEETASPSLSPKLPSKTRWSWGASSPPVSPASAYTPPMTPCYSPLNSPPPTNVPLQSAFPATVSLSANSTAPPIQASDILPVPAAFRDPAEHGFSKNELSAVKNVTEATIKPPPLTPPALVKQLTPPKSSGIKTASTKNSGLGPSTSLTRHSSMETGQGIGGNQSPRQLRNNQPRPASLGNRKDFLHAKGEDLQAGHATSKEPDSQKPVSTQTGFQHSRESAKLPRSEGVSVLICPSSENGENRRQALRKLGLLRD